MSSTKIQSSPNILARPEDTKFKQETLLVVVESGGMQVLEKDEKRPRDLQLSVISLMASTRPLFSTIQTLRNRPQNVFKHQPRSRQYAEFVPKAPMNFKKPVTQTFEETSKPRPYMRPERDLPPATVSTLTAQPSRDDQISTILFCREGGQRLSQLVH